MIQKDFQNNLKLYEYLKDFITPEKLQKIENLVNERSNFIVPVMEDIYQFRNAGAIVRSMEAFGFQTLYAFENRNSFIPESSVSRGADKWIDIHFMQPNIDSLKKIKDKGYLIATISPEKTAINIQDYIPNQPTAVIFGTEFRGISKEFLDFSDICIQIPMLGFTESLNVSVAAGICFYEMRNKLKKSNLNWKLTQQEKLNLKIKWAINSVSSGEEIAKHYLKNVKI